MNQDFVKLDGTDLTIYQQHNPMTNFERWQIYTSGLSSPQNFVDWSYRYLISASLQRRVWLGPSHQQCFANQYCILVGQPGIGKGICIKEVSNFLKHWKLKDAVRLSASEQTTKHTADAIADEEMRNAQESELKSVEKKNAIEPLLIPVAADATTYEALVSAVSESFRRVNFIDKDKEGKEKLGIYGHSSICFSLQELASLIRKRTDDTVNYMLGLYDCPDTYEYDTKTQGKDRVKRGCLNLFAGTTPTFMQSVFNEELVGEGFSSRCFFIYAPKNRKHQFFIPPLTAEQEECKRVILDHIRKLTALYGNVRIDRETEIFLEQWWNEYCENMSKRANQSIKLLPYYSRKNIHVMKVAMAIHFGESTEMFIPLETFKLAIKVLDEEEKNMHLAITMESKNPLANLSKRILEYLSTGDKNYVDVHIETYDMGDKKQLEEALLFLQETNQIDVNPREDKTTGKTEMWYTLIKK